MIEVRVNAVWPVTDFQVPATEFPILSNNKSHKIPANWKQVDSPIASAFSRCWHFSLYWSILTMFQCHQELTISLTDVNHLWYSGHCPGCWGSSGEQNRPHHHSWELPRGADNNSNKNHDIVLLTLELCKSDQKVLCFIRGGGARQQIEQGIFRKPGS